MERPLYAGRGTVLTAPVRLSSPTPERDAPRGTGSGMTAFGQGAQGLAQGLDRANEINARKNAEMTREKQRIADNDLTLAARRIAREADAAVSAAHPDRSTYLPDRMPEVTGLYQNEYNARMAEYLKINSQGNITAEEQQAIKNEPIFEYGKKAVDNQHQLVVSYRYDSTASEYDSQFRRLPPVIDAVNGKAAVDGTEKLIQSIDDLSPLQYDPERFKKPLRNHAIKSLNDNFSTSLAGTTEQGRDGMIAASQSAVDKGLRTPADHVEYVANIDKIIQAHKIYDYDSMDRAAKQIKDDLQSGTTTGHDTQLAANNFVKIKSTSAARGKALGEIAINGIRGEALLSILDGKVQQALRSVKVDVAPDNPNLPAPDMVSAAQSFRDRFLSSSDEEVQRNFQSMAKNTKLATELTGGEQGLAAITTDEIRKWALGTNAIMEERARTVDRGESYKLVEQTDNFKAGIARIHQESGRRIGQGENEAAVTLSENQQVRSLYSSLSTALGISDAQAVNMPSSVARNLAHTLASAKSGETIQMLTQIAHGYGSESLKMIRSLVSMRKLGPDGKATGQMVVDEQQAAMMYVTIFPQIAKNSTDKSRQLALALSFSAAEALSRRDAVETDRKTRVDAWKLLDDTWESAITSDQLRPFMQAAQDDRYAGPVLRKGLVPLIKSMAEQNFLRNGNAIGSISDAIKQVSLSMTPIRTGVDGSSRYAFVHTGAREFEDNTLPFAQYGVNETTKQWAEAQSAMMDVAIIASRPKGIEGMNPIFKANEDVSNSFLGNLVGIHHTTRGKASTIATERIPSFTGSAVRALRAFNPLADVGLGALPAFSEPRFQPFGSLNLDYGNMYISNGVKGVDPIAPSNYASIEKSLWAPKEMINRVKGQLQGKENVSPEVINAVTIGQNRVWLINAERGTRELWVETAAVGGVHQPTSLMQVTKKNSVGGFDPVEISETDINWTYDLGRKRALGWFDSSPFTFH